MMQLKRKIMLKRVLFHNSSTLIYLGFVDKKIVEDIQMESDFTIEEFYSNMTDLPIMLK